MAPSDVGILLGLISAVTFVFFSLWSREVQHREGHWRFMVYISAGPALIGLLTWLVPALRPDFSWPLVRGVAYAAAPAMTGLFFMGLACRWGDISHVGPVMGSKALVITVLAVTFGFEPVAPEFWGASVILLVALFLVSGNRDVLRRPWRIVSPALVFAMLMCIFASLADLISRRQMADHNLAFWDFLTVGWVLRGGFCTAVLLVACAVRRLPVMPRRASTFWVTTPLVIAHGFAIVGAFKLTNSAVLTNVLTSLRGVFSVVAIVVLARLNFGRREELSRGVIVARVIGSLLICSGVWLGLTARGKIESDPVEASPTEPAKADVATAPPGKPGSPREVNATPQPPATLPRLYARAAKAVRGGQPVVVTVHVCLCDNRQGIKPVKAEFGNGDSPRTNLYWGAMYGLRTFLGQSDQWKLLAERDGPGDLLKQTVFAHRATVAGALWPADVRGKPVEVILVARAWRGMPMTSALGAFARDALTAESAEVRLPDGRTIAAGGASHVVGFVGHDSLMNADVREQGLFRAIADRDASPPAKGWFALACVSDTYFTPRLGRRHLVRLLATRQFMSPEAYTLDAMLRGFARGGDLPALRSAAAGAYAEYQKISTRAALGVFAN